MNDQTRSASAVHDLDASSLSALLTKITERAGHWLQQRRNPSGPGFSLCNHAYAPVELNATTGGIELWVMLGLPLSDDERAGWIEHLTGYQSERTGLVIDPTWADRQIARDEAQLIDGDSFFTMTSTGALDALGGQFQFPVKYLTELSVDRLRSVSSFDRIAHNPLGVGDFGRLVRHNMQLGVPGSQEQWAWVNDMLTDAQDESGLWPKGEVRSPFTPDINRGFHILRSSWNLTGQPIARADRMLDLCLAASDDANFYGWNTGYACNDLDLAHVFYSASGWTDHRKEEVAEWARRALGQILSVEKLGGGFSFYHETAMDKHAGIRMSPRRAEADTWGTLMYMGAIKMMVELGWPGLQAPWTFSHVHAVSAGAAK